MANNPNAARRELKKHTAERMELDTKAIKLIKEYRKHWDAPDDRFFEWLETHFVSYILRIGAIKKEN